MSGEGLNKFSAAPADKDAEGENTAFARELAELRARLLAIREGGEKDIDPGFSRPADDAAKNIDPGFGLNVRGNKDIDPGFSRSTAEITRVGDFIVPIREFCDKYGIAMPQFTNIENTLKSIETRRKTQLRGGK